ncbi:hypothetical protein TNCV_458521 [Trichonephila clavipes]|nr:hypothetical protein TNCV_458521 [Trichonephila clavipes]
MCCVPSGQLQATHFCSDSRQTLGARLGSDYHLLIALQNSLSDKKFGPEENCVNRLLEVFVNKSQYFYERRIMKPPVKLD